jgi:hypothetical protein
MSGMYAPGGVRIIASAISFSFATHFLCLGQGNSDGLLA